MSKMKDLLMDMVEMYDDDYTIKQIADITGMPQDVVFDILQRYSRGLVEESTTLQ
jgi:predicted DNA-binding protein YlxM (UPF0122 family)